jgi:dolichyl-diphosphooligosaccharide--protein glycosyltransferase
MTQQSSISEDRIACSPWFTLLVPCILTYGISLALRLMELPAWQPDFYQVGGEKLMATHDAYFWMAGAQGTSWATEMGLMWVLSFLHGITSASLGDIAFFLPVLLAPLAALPLCFLAWKQGMPEAGVGAGIMATACAGYFLRTRLGFCDTDPLALFFPTFLAVAFILWTTPYIRPQWFRKTSQKNDEPPHTDSITTLCKPAGIGTALGLTYWLAMWFYPSSQDIILAFFLTTVFVALILAKEGMRYSIVFGLVCFYAVGYAGWPGVGLAALLTGALCFVPGLMTNKKNMWLLLALAVTILFFLSGLHLRFWTIFSKLIILGKTSTFDPAGNGTTILFPAVQQSIREAQNIDLANLYARISGNAPLFWLGLPAYIYLVWKKPLYLVFLPILVLSVASVKLGNRFTMYGGIVWGIGLSFGLSTLLKAYKSPATLRILAQIMLCLAILWPVWNMAVSTRPAPILPRIYAQTFKELEKQTPPDARLWQWWDYGYAAQYYAKRMSFGDGAKHEGPWLYPMALVHCTDSPMQAAQVIKYTTQSQLEEFKNNSTATSVDTTGWTKPWYNVHPTAGLEAMSSIDAEKYIANLRTEPQSWTNLPPQYFIVSWENLRLAYWISYFGNWDLVTGKASPGKIQRMSGTMQFDIQHGRLKIGSKSIPLASMDVLTDAGDKHLSWPNGKNLHAVMNQLSKEVYLMDTKIYRSMMIQMLIAPPKQFEPYFKLQIDHFPWARAYMVK